MIAVIIAGGSGTRLWPLSTPDYPKHLLKLAGERSLLQNTVERAQKVADDIYIITEASHIEHVYEQLPEIAHDHILVEPGRRGTASCVIAVLARIKQSGREDDQIVFMHADHHIRDTQGFIETLHLAREVSNKEHQIVLLGLEPTSPATGYGYIERGKRINGQQVYEVLSFKEKPDRLTAQKYVKSGRYLWNMGYFVASLAVFESAINTYAPELWQKYQTLLESSGEEELKKRYLSFASESIDQALIEHVENLLLIPGSFDWMDLGSFPDVHQVNLHDAEGNTLEGRVLTDGVTNSLIRNDTELPVAVIGLDNVVIVSTKHGILVASKGHAQKVGDIAKKLSSNS